MHERISPGGRDACEQDATVRRARSGQAHADRPATPLEERSQMAYPGNRRPLENKHLIRLPFGSIGPAGWLERQLQIEADGLARRLLDSESIHRCLEPTLSRVESEHG